MSTAQRRIQRYGWRPSLKSPFDPLKDIPADFSGFPPSVSLRDKFTPVYDQGQLGSCTANAIAGAIDYERLKQGLAAINPSRLFIYYNERSIEGDVAQDAGAQIRDGILTVTEQGVCPESEWPYDTSQFASKPTPQCYTDALANRTLKYASVRQTLYGLRYQLAHGFPTIFGFTVYESFESDAVAKSGMVPMPQPGEQIVGGHATVVVGYREDPSGLLFEVRNSWGPDWGDAGYFWMPGAYLADPNLASDMWELRIEA